MKPNDLDAGKATLNELCMAVVGIVRTRCEDRYKQCEMLDALICGQPTEQLSVAALKYAFALNSLPFAMNSKKIPGKSCISGLSMRDADRLCKKLTEMQRTKKINCCIAFKGKTSDEAAKMVYDQLKLVEKEAGITGRVLWLRAILESDHVPNADIIHPYAEGGCEDPSVALAASPELFGEMVTLMRTRNSVLGVARWISSLDCDNETKAAMIAYLASRVGNGNQSIGLVLGGGMGGLDNLDGLAEMIASGMLRVPGQPN